MGHLRFASTGLPVQVKVLKRFRWGETKEGPWTRYYEPEEIIIIDQEQLEALTKNNHVTRNF